MGEVTTPSQQPVSHDNDHALSYRNILRSLAAFGGVQGVQILLNLIRGKFVAVLLGPEGMGLQALYNTAATTLQQLSAMGLNLALVKEVSRNRHNHHALKGIINGAMLLLPASALLGALLMVVGAPWLSEMTFGDASHASDLRWLALMIAATTIGSGLFAMIQGLHQVKVLTVTSVCAALIGLLVSVPLYYIYGLSGIVPALIATPALMVLFYILALRHSLKANRETVGNEPSANHLTTTAALIRRLLQAGMVLVAGTVAATLVAYLINAFIRALGSPEEVGLYQAANSVTNQYAGVIFAALSLDYFPRLTALAHDNSRMHTLVNRQVEIIMLAMTPIVCALILTAPLLIRLLLSEAFLPIAELMRWMGLGILLKALSYPLGYITFAKDNQRVFFWSEAVAANLIDLLACCTGYAIGGLVGIGIGFCCANAMCTVLYLIVNRRYRFGLTAEALRVTALSVTLSASVFALSFIKSEWTSYTCMGVITMLAAVVALRRILLLMKK